MLLKGLCLINILGMLVSVGPPFGGLFYTVGGKDLPFFVLAGLIFLTFGLYYFLLFDYSVHTYSFHHMIV